MSSHFDESEIPSDQEQRPNSDKSDSEQSDSERSDSRRSGSERSDSKYSDSEYSDSQPKSFMGQRLQRVMASAGIGSRRECELLILEGRVEIDGQIVATLGVKVDPDIQKIFVDGDPLRLQRLEYYMLNKPPGVVSTTRDPGGRARVIDLIKSQQRVYNVGRLDQSSEGLILVTNDGELANRLTHPRYGIEKRYSVLVDGVPTREQLRSLEEGVYIAEGKAKASEAKIVKRSEKNCWLEIVLSEGRNREIRRLLAKIGHKVRVLRRIAIGPLKMASLPVGAHRRLRNDELKLLRQVTGLNSDAKGDSSKNTTRTSKGTTTRASKGDRVSVKRQAEGVRKKTGSDKRQAEGVRKKTGFDKRYGKRGGVNQQTRAGKTQSTPTWSKSDGGKSRSAANSSASSKRVDTSNSRSRPTGKKAPVKFELEKKIGPARKSVGKTGDVVKTDRKMDQMINQNTDRKFDRKFDKTTDRKIDKKIDKNTDRKTDWKTDRKIDKKIDRKFDKKTDRKIDRKIDKNTDRKKSRQDAVVNTRKGPAKKKTQNEIQRTVRSKRRIHPKGRSR